MSATSKYPVGDPAPSLRRPIVALDEVGFVVRNPPAAGGGGESTHPFQVVNASDGDGAKASVVFGTVNDYPVTISSIQLDAAVPPTLSISATSWVYLKLTIDDATGEPTVGEIFANATIPSNTTSYAYVALARVNYSGGLITSISQSVTGSLWVRRCYGALYNVNRV